jgi:cytochrome c6
MMFRFVLVLLFSLLLNGLVMAGPPVLAGKVLFQKNCRRCHGANGRLGLNGAHDLTRSNLNAFGRTYLVTNGMGKMPAFKKQLTPAQIEAIVQYSLTLK